MIVTWMLASTLFALILGAAAWLAERALTSIGKPRRAPWVLAIGVATAWPLIAGAWFLASPQPTVAMITTRIGASAAAAVTSRFTAGPSLELIANRALVGFWVLASLLLVARIVVGIVRMRTVLRTADEARVNETDVLMTDATGPAVCGVRHPRIVVPRWIMELDGSLRAMVLRHEQEHRDRGDGGLVLGGAIAIALVPWNAAVWLMVRRLRLAIELDCDERVLATHADSNHYGKLLMLVAQRQTHARLLPMLAESNAHLERRIGEMNSQTQQRSRVRASALGLVAAATAVLAGSTPVMAGVTHPSSPNNVLLVPVKTMTRANSRGKVLELPAAVAVPEHEIVLQGTAQGTPKKAPPPPPPAPQSTGAQPKNAPPPPPPAPQGGAKEFREFRISKGAAEAQNSAQPKYPQILKSAGVEGEVLIQLVVEADGTPMAGALKILKTSHPLFADAVREAYPNMRYTPAEVDGRKVKQLVQQAFVFAIGQAYTAADTMEKAVRSQSGAESVPDGASPANEVRKLPQTVIMVKVMRPPQ